MTTITLKGAVYLDTKGDTGFGGSRYCFMGGPAQDWMQYKLVAAHTIEVESTINETAVLVAGMKAEITRLNLEAHKATQALRDRISKLTCLEMDEAPIPF